jgi:hypothetical protein
VNPSLLDAGPTPLREQELNDIVRVVQDSVASSEKEDAGLQQLSVTIDSQADPLRLLADLLIRQVADNTGRSSSR